VKSSSSGETSLWPVYLMAAAVVVGAVLLGALLAAGELGYWFQHRQWTAVTQDEAAQLLAWSVLPGHWGHLSHGYPPRMRTMEDGRILWFVGVELLLFSAVLAALVFAWWERGGRHREGVGSGPPSEGRLSRRHRV